MMLAPNKQNLLLLKSRKKTTSKGLKLLKEKRNSLINSFLTYAREGKLLEKKVSSDMGSFLQQFSAVIATVDKEELKRSIERDSKAVTALQVSQKKVAGVSVQELDLEVATKERGWKSPVQGTFNTFNQHIPHILALVQYQINCKRFAYEIKKVNRQIVNVEKRIEEISKDIKRIKQALMERDNFEKATLIKLFSNI